MPISTVTNRVEYAGNGTSAVFAWPYRVNSPTHLGVFIFNSSFSSPSVITPQVLNTDFTFSGTANSQGIYESGGNIIFNSSPNALSTIIIFRSSVVTNEFRVLQNGAIPATSLNNEIDYLTMIQQRAQDLATRSTRLQDGWPGTFDTTLPSNIKEAAGKRLIVNSTATGWTFDETIGNFTPNTLVVARNNSTVTSFGGTIDGPVLLSRGSSGPEWGAVNLASSENVVGLLPIARGGTNNGSNYTDWGVLYYDQALSAFRSIPAQIIGSLLTVNSGAPPSFQTFSANNINSGVVAVANGGTGSAGLSYDGPVKYINSSFVVASTSLTQDVTGILPTSLGGTNNSNYIQYGVIYAGQNNQLATVPSGVGGYVLTAQGSSAPVFSPVSVTLNVNTINGGATLTPVNNTVKLNGASQTIRLYDSLNNAGRELSFIHLGTSISSVYTIVGSGTQTIGRYGTSIQMHTFDQYLGLQVSDDGNWLVKDSRTETDWILAGSTIIDASTTPPTKVTANGRGYAVVDRLWYKRVGAGAHIRHEFNQVHNSSAGVSPGSGSYLFGLPPGLILDTISIAPNGPANAPQGGQTNLMVGNAISYGSGVAIGVGEFLVGGVVLHGTTTFKIVGGNVAGNLSNYAATGASITPMSRPGSSGQFASFFAPISGWIT